MPHVKVVDALLRFRRRERFNFLGVVCKRFKQREEIVSVCWGGRVGVCVCGAGENGRASGKREGGIGEERDDRKKTIKRTERARVRGGGRNGGK
jgi:hypothetical protein